MRNQLHHGLDSLVTKGYRLFATKQVLVTVLSVVGLPGIRASFFMSLPAHQPSHQAGQLMGHPDGCTGTRDIKARTKPGLAWLRFVGLRFVMLQPERLHNALRSHGMGFRVMAG